jgi:prolyl-tRNA synthetase
MAIAAIKIPNAILTGLRMAYGSAAAYRCYCRRRCCQWNPGKLFATAAFAIVNAPPPRASRQSWRAASGFFLVFDWLAPKDSRPMKWTQTLIPTLRESPADAEIPSHRLLLRGGFIRPVSAGFYSFLPLGLRALKKVERIVREEMDKAGAIEVLMPSLHPQEIWEKTGRFDALREILFKITDRTGRKWVLGPTHEEIVTSIVAAEVRSYRQLPKNIYQIQMKFRDEPRPRFGLIRGKEFLMKDAYSFDADEAGADRSYQTMLKAYRRIFERCGLNTIVVEASSGAMGGRFSHEFMVRSSAGEDRVASCDKCGYAANLEKASSRLVESAAAPPSELEKFPTPNVRTIEDLTKAPYHVAASRQIKTLVYVLDGKLALLLVRGDQELNEAKLVAATGAHTARPAHPEEIRALLGAWPGSLGAVGVKTGDGKSAPSAVIADESLRGATGMTTGANVDDFHYRGVDMGRDIAVTQWADLRTAQAGEGCPRCDGLLRVDSTIEVGHVFKLGTKYSAALGATFLDEQGERKPCIMGCYGIGVSRILAAVVEQHHDEQGIIWPRAIAPYEAAILPLNTQHAPTMRVAADLYEGLAAAGVDVILDDRADRPGVKFNDADLVGFPVRVTIGEKSLAKGVVEIKARGETQPSAASPAEAVQAVLQKLASV